MRVNCNSLMMEKISKFASIGEIRKLLFDMTDNDFNGSNGSEYFVSIEINGKLLETSKLDYWIYQYDKYDNKVADFIYDVLEDCYSDSYYYDYSIKTMEVGDVLVVACSYADYC